MWSRWCDALILLLLYIKAAQAAQAGGGGAPYGAAQAVQAAQVGGGDAPDGAAQAAAAEGGNIHQPWPSTMAVWANQVTPLLKAAADAPPETCAAALRALLEFSSAHTAKKPPHPSRP